MSKQMTEYAFLFKGAINPLALIYAQTTSSLMIQSVVYKAGVYYVTLGVSIMTGIEGLESYIGRCANNGIIFEKLDIDNPSFEACYMYKVK